MCFILYRDDLERKTFEVSFAYLVGCLVTLKKTDEPPVALRASVHFSAPHESHFALGGPEEVVNEEKNNTPKRELFGGFCDVLCV